MYKRSEIVSTVSANARHSAALTIERWIEPPKDEMLDLLS